MKYNILKNNSFVIYIFFFILIFTILYILNKSVERFQNVTPPTNPIGTINDPRDVLLFKPQSNLFTGNANKYWKNYPVESNSNFIDDIPPPVQEIYLELPKEAKYGDNSYRKGLFNYSDLIKGINDNINILNDMGTFEEKLLNPTTLEPMKYKYEVDFEIDKLNRKSWIDRWQQYNPIKKMYYNYDEIKSPIDDVNKLNLEFKKRCYDQQQYILNNNQLINFGIIPFDIYKYRIDKIEYNTNNINLRKFIIRIMLYRESDLYLTTLSYIGVIKDNKTYIFESEYVGGSPQDEYLMPESVNVPRTKSDVQYEVINKNYSKDNTKILELDPDNVAFQMKKYKDQFKLDNQVSCFNPDPRLNRDFRKDDQYILTFNSSDRNNFIMTRELCESQSDWYGRKKKVGILDQPCKKDEECPFYKGNKNYENKFGKCKNGYCELPSNMKSLGYRYFSPDDLFKPLCYNCDSKDFLITTDLRDCCEEQFDKTKYPFLNGPDYAFDGDYKDRYNHFIKKNCYRNSKNELVCS